MSFRQMKEPEHKFDFDVRLEILEAVLDAEQSSFGQLCADGCPRPQVVGRPEFVLKPTRYVALPRRGRRRRRHYKRTTIPELWLRLPLRRRGRFIQRYTSLLSTASTKRFPNHNLSSLQARSPLLRGYYMEGEIQGLDFFTQFCVIVQITFVTC